MKVRYEEGNLLADFNYRGWNPQTLVYNIEEDDYNEFVNMCELEYGDLDSVNLTEAIHILMLMSSEGYFYF